jgi:signal transduction histidine kinase
MPNNEDQTINLNSQTGEQISSPFKRYSNGSPFKSTVGFQWRILLRVLLLFITLTVASLFLVNQWYLFLALLSPLVFYQLIEFIRFQKKTHEELNEFVEAIHYRDFSRYFDVKHAPADILPLRKGFNEINSTFKVISKEKETQYQYLQKILELIDTGILSYEIESGEIVWMNESLKRMLQLPYLKTINSLEKRDRILF